MPSTRSSLWHRLDGTAYDGPLVVARIARPAVPPDPAWPSYIELPALIDTGATHSIVDPDRVAGPLGLRHVDHRRMRVAGPGGRTTMPVFEAAVHFPAFRLPRRVLNLGATQLPPAFGLLIGMDLLEGTRMAIEWARDGRWLRWETIPPDSDRETAREG
jgi:predicted aspartyl protease